MIPDLLASAPLRATENIAGWLLTSLWQGTLVAIATALLMRLFLRRCRPALKGALWVVVLLKFVVPGGPGFGYSAATLFSAIGDALITESPTAPASGSSGITLSLVAMDSFTAAPAAISSTSGLDGISSWLKPAAVGAYLMLLAVACGIQWVGYRRILRNVSGLPCAEAWVAKLVADVCDRVGAPHISDVRVSSAYPAPFILGLFRPRLVLSLRQLEDVSELEAVILHEVAHLRRGDMWVRWLQCLAGTLLFFWPVVAWVNRRLDLIRELACDEWALRHGRLSNGQYARCLLRAASPVPVRLVAWRPVAMASNVKTVERRIEMIMQQVPRRGGWVSTMTACLALAGWSLFVLGGARADAGKTEEIKQTPPEDVVIEGTPIEIELEIGDLESDGEHEIWWSDGSEGEFEFQIIGDGEFDPDALPMPGAWFTEGQGRARIMLHGSPPGAQGAPRMMAFASKGGFPIVPPKFIEEAPSADVDGDGQVSREEYTAYHVAVALKNPQAVLEKYPTADRNKDGELDAIEAARLIMRPPMPPMMSYAFTEGGEGAALGVHPVRIAVTRSDGDPASGELRVEARVEGGTHDIQVEARGDAPPIVRRRIVKPDGSEEVTEETVVPGQGADPHVVAFQGHEALETSADWMRKTIVFQPKTRDVKPHLGVLEQATAVAFLERHPDADSDGDGKISSDERKVADEKARKSSLTRMKEMHAKMLGEHPDWDTDKNGELTREEVRAGMQREKPAEDVKPGHVEVIREVKESDKN